MLDFAQMDLAQLRAGHWLNLREDLEAFILGTRAKIPAPSGRATAETAPVRTTPLMEPTPQEMSPEAFQALQAEVRGFFDNLIPKNKGVREHTLLGEADLRTGPLRVIFDRRGLVTVVGSTRDSVLITLGLLLGRFPPHALLRCPECDTIVFRDRKNQDYCSRRCVTRVNQRHRRVTKGKRQPDAVL
jgi:hypothetical protein